MTETNFTQEQVDEAISNAKTEWTEQELTPLVTERDDLLQYKPVDKTEAETAFEEKQRAQFEREVGLTLKEQGLSEFADVINVDNEEDLAQVMKSLTKIKSQLKIDSSYVPENHKAEDEYSKYQKDKNTVGMIGSKIGKMFG